MMVLALDPSSAGKDDDPQDDYPRPDPSARASQGPELPLADEEDHPPALDVESEPEDYHDADIVDYESSQEEEEEAWYADVRSFHTECRRWRPRKLQTDEQFVKVLKADMNRCIDQEHNEEEDGVEMQCDYEQIS